MKNKSVRLPNHVTPQHYKLQITPDMEAFTFAGEEQIKLTLTKANKTIVLHSKDIEILDGWFEARKQIIAITKITYQDKAETATLNFSKVLPTGQGKLTLHFRGIISEKLHGFYRSQYEHLGETKYIATTQFESTDARRAFPCFDEPAHKAIFELSLVIPKHLTAISNTIETGIAETPAGVEHSHKIVHFAPTPKMSTYLLAYILGEFESIETNTKHEVKIRVFTTKGKKHQAKFALKVAKKSLEFLNEYFAIDYPLPVLDLIAIPDFSSGAMENWGAVTFRETALLVDEEHTAFANRQQIAETVAHELVHQWFGNLVTMEWWTHLWLNESFASFMSYLVIDHIFPEWHFWTRFVLHDHANALQLDSLQNTHPIEVEVHHPDQISEIFDAISYDKGASVLRMLYYYLGPEYFRQGLRYYLKKHSYKNTSSEQLWAAFTKVSKKPIGKFMHTWVATDGYPLVKVAHSKSALTAVKKIIIEQSRFSLKRGVGCKTTWPIPVQFQINSKQTSGVELVSTKRKTLSLAAGVKFIKANPGETGFYRTLYSAPLLAQLFEPVRTKQLSIEDRFGIIRDLGALAKSGSLPTSAFLEFVQAYQNEDSYVIWAEICGSLQDIHNAAQNVPKLQTQLEIVYRELLNNTVKLVGWTAKPKESQSRTLLRSLILSQFGLYGDKATCQKALQLLHKHHRKPIPADMRNVVYTLSAKSGSAQTFSLMKKLFASATMQEEQRRIARGLMNFENPTIFKQSLEMLLSSAVRSQDMPILIHIALLNANNRTTVWMWLKQNWPKIVKRYHKDHLLVWIIKPLGLFASPDKAKEIAAFFKKNPAPSANRALKQALEQIHINSAWIKRDRQDIENYLRTLR